jgi:hypothetical protein
MAATQDRCSAHLSIFQWVPLGRPNQGILSQRARAWTTGAYNRLIGSRGETIWVSIFWWVPLGRPNQGILPQQAQARTTGTCSRLIGICSETIWVHGRSHSRCLRSRSWRARFFLPANASLPVVPRDGLFDIVSPLLWIDGPPSLALAIPTHVTNKRRFHADPNFSKLKRWMVRKRTIMSLDWIILKKSKERASVKVAAKKSIKTPVSIVSN